MLEVDKIHNLDCLDGLKQLEDQSIDIVITSPPYNLGKRLLSRDYNRVVKIYEE